MKLEIIIDADRDTVWREFENGSEKSKWQPTLVTERREPDFIAGISESEWSKAIVVNHFDKIDADRTRWVFYANHQFKGLRKLAAIFVRNSIGKRTEDNMQRFKLSVESKLAKRR